ncbi:MAG: alpha-rhamnosidase, partial [Bacteroidales bacterium]|nr:alpha-rhamnosidase [Bacteroidales bacterium]
WLDVWRENLALGMTTVGETSDVNGTRSDCHAWGASPNIEFFRTLLGIDSDAIAFKKVKIEPHLGNITKIGGTMPHPDGEITVSYNVNKGTMNAEITLPASISGKFVWNGKEYQLKGGKNTITAK